MTDGALKLVRFVCIAPAHVDGRSGSAITIHEGEWAYCAAGYDLDGHEWSATDGLPDHVVMRFPPRTPVATPPDDRPHEERTT